MLEYAVNEANDKIFQSSDIRLDVANEVIEYGREYAVSERVCSLLEVWTFYILNICLSNCNNSLN